MPTSTELEFVHTKHKCVYDTMFNPFPSISCTRKTCKNYKNRSQNGIIIRRQVGCQPESHNCNILDPLFDHQRLGPIPASHHRRFQVGPQRHWLSLKDRCSDKVGNVAGTKCLECSHQQHKKENHENMGAC